MSEGVFSLKKLVPVILITWILSLSTTLALVYVAPSIFPPLGTANLEDSAITASKIADGAIVTVKLSDGTVTSAKIVDGTISAQDLMDGSILAIKVADGAISTDKIANSSVTAGKIADDAIVSSKVAENAIVTVKMADNSVTSAKVLDGTIVGEDLANGAVVTVNVADGAITTAKIDDKAVTTPKLADNAVTSTKLAADAIPYAAVYNTSLASTISTSFIDMPNMSLEITLARRSNLIIMFNAEAWVDGAGDSLYVRALVDSTVANPNSGSLILLTSAGSSQHGSYAVNFYLEDVDAGTHTVKIQWSEMLGANYAHVADRILNVIALPA